MQFQVWGHGHKFWPNIYKIVVAYCPFVRSPLPPLHNTSDYIVPVQVDPHKATINGNSSDSEMDDKVCDGI